MAIPVLVAKQHIGLLNDRNVLEILIFTHNENSAP